MKMKIILIKKAMTTTTTSTEIFKCYKKNPVLWSIKIPINSTLFDAQNTGNRISELLDFKFFWGGGGGHAPFSGHSCHLQSPLIINIIESPDRALYSFILDLSS